MDEFWNLPVGLGLAMASKLLESEKIDFNSFWQKGGELHFFSGDGKERRNGLKQLFRRYSDEFDLEDYDEESYILNDAKEYFGFENSE